MGVVDRAVPDQLREMAAEPDAELSHAVARQIRDEPWVLAIARAGWVAKGVVYSAIGWSAVKIGLQEPVEADAEYTGIVALLADHPLSRALLAVIAVGLVFYIAFRVLSTVLIDDNDLDAWAHRIAYLFSALTYVTVGWAAAQAVIAGVDPQEGSRVERTSQALLETTGGRWALAVGAIGALGIALYFAYKGLSRRFLRQICTEDIDSGRVRRTIVWTGATGWVGRALLVGAVSVFVLWSAYTADPDEARGLDRTLQELATATWGRILVIVIAVLLMAYSAYCIASARYQDVTWNRDGGESER